MFPSKLAWCCDLAFDILFHVFSSNVTWIDSIIMLLEQKDFSDTLVKIRVLIKCDNLFDSGFIAIFICHKLFGKNDFSYLYMLKIE